MERLDRIDALLPVETASATATRELGARLAGQMGAGDILALYGDLGAGKTELVKGLCGKFGIDEHDVNSPTFKIVNEYRSGSIPIFHFDAYRIKGLDEFYDLGYEDYFFDEGLAVVEWAEKVESLLPEDAVRIRLEHLPGDRRRISLLRKEEVT
ncbi:MAG: tRNA (adenosine(37)-N6)-threonylcarbamoyltransferase complex ATPase subunit type 1 TsaE [Rhodothermales bacterium]